MLSVQALTHKALLKIGRVGQPVLGRYYGPGSYDLIRDAFAPATNCADEFSLDPAAIPLTEREVESAAATLDRYGVVVLRRLVDPALAAAARLETAAYLECIAEAMAVPELQGTLDGIPWQVGAPGAPAVAPDGAPLIHLRSRDRGALDAGVVDIFSIEKLARDREWQALSRCCALLESESFARIIGAVLPRERRRTDLLCSESAVATRGLHVDNLLNRFKAFLYLSDVRSAADGPLAYVPGTHRRIDLLMREALLNTVTGRNESDSVAFEGHEIPILGLRGTVIICCQTGVHRSMPQREGASRAVLVGHYSD